MTEQPKPPPFFMRAIPHKGEMLLVFSVATDMVTLGPDEARQLVNALLEFAESVSPKGKMQ